MKKLKRSTLVLGCAGWLSFCPATNLVMAQNAPIASSRPGPPPAMISTPALAFDAEIKEYDAKPLDVSAPFIFTLRNTWTNEIIIRSVRTSCGCTVATLPTQPWHLAPGESGDVHAAVNLVGKAGTIEKTLTFDTTVGPRVATVRVVIPRPPAPVQPSLPVLSEADRKKAMLLAGADARAIFRGDCAECHVRPAQGKMGVELYTAACGICHDSPHRATMVPDLHALKQPTNYKYWKQIIRNGKPDTMMPSFAEPQGGPLTDAQITSLCLYLEAAIPKSPSK